MDGYTFVQARFSRENVGDSARGDLKKKRFGEDFKGVFSVMLKLSAYSRSDCGYYG